MHISRVNRGEIAGDRPRQLAHEIFSIEHRFQQARFQSFLRTRPAHAGARNGYPR